MAQQPDRFTITVEIRSAGFTEFADRDRQRIFTHTEVDDEFEGRGLATIVVEEALKAARDAGLRVVPVCKLVAAYIDKHPEFRDIVDPPTPDIDDWLRTAS